MERVAFLIEATHTRIACMLNPESFEIRRSSGVTRTSAGQLVDSDLSDDPLIFSGRGSTDINLQLLFDVTLAGSTIHSNDVRALTGPLWELAEYKTDRRTVQELPIVRFIWGKAWNIPVIVSGVSERFERFNNDGTAQRSWLALSLMRVSEIVRSNAVPKALDPAKVPARIIQEGGDPSWGAHQILGGGVEGDRLDQLAGQYYGWPDMWRLIAVANHIDDPSNVPAGTVLQVPPLSILRRSG